MKNFVTKLTTKNIKQSSRIIWRFLLVVYQHFIDDGCMYRSAALTYTSLLSLVPLMTVSFAIFSAFPVFERLSSKIQTFIFAHFVAASGEVIQTYLQHFMKQTANLSAIGSVFLVVTAVLMMFNMEQAFNSIWHIKKRRSAVSAFLLYWAVLTLSPILIGLSVVMGNYILSAHLVTTAADVLGITQIMVNVLPFILIVITFTIIYIYVPNCAVPIRYAFAGAFIAGILFEIAKFAIAYYVTHFPTYILLYGALATIPIFLIWLYSTWLIILFGAVISNVLTVGYQYRSDEKMDGFTQVFRWLGHLWIAFHEGKSLSLRQLVELDESNYQIAPERQLELMEQAKLIQTTGDGRYMLTQDLTSFHLRDLMRELPWRLPTRKELEQWPYAWEKKLIEIIEKANTEMGDTLDIPLAKLYSCDE